MMAASEPSQNPPAMPNAPVKHLLLRTAQAGLFFRLAAGCWLAAAGVPWLAGIALAGAAINGTAWGWSRLGKWNAGVIALAIEWWFQAVSWAAAFGGEANFQLLTLLPGALALLLDHWPRPARVALGAAAVVIVVIDNVKLAGLPPAITLAPAAQLALAQLNLLAVIIGAAAIVRQYVRYERESRERADQRAQSAARMTASLSHELKTPITAIITTAQSMLRYERSSDKYKQALALCERNSRGMSQLIRRMLDLLDASADSTAPQLQTIEAKAILEECVDLHSPLALDKEVSLLVVCPAGKKILSDPDLLGIMLNNLIGNAVRYTPRQKSVIIRHHEHEDGSSLSIADEGPGIPESDLPHIFDAFYRAGKKRDRSTGNYGLGLALTAQIAAKLGIQIEVESEVGAGTCFRLRIPRPPE